VFSSSLSLHNFLKQNTNTMYEEYEDAFQEIDENMVNDGTLGVGITQRRSAVKDEPSDESHEKRTRVKTRYKAEPRQKDGNSMKKKGRRRKDLGRFGNHHGSLLAGLQKRGQCAVAKCKNLPQGTVVSQDSHGAPGRRCVRHGGGYRCSVPTCKSGSQGVVTKDDMFGGPGHRCVRHGGGKRCSVPDCKRGSQGTVSERDVFGAPGLRCCRHGGKRKLKTSRRRRDSAGGAGLVKGKKTIRSKKEDVRDRRSWSQVKIDFFLQLAIGACKRPRDGTGGGEDKKHLHTRVKTEAI